MPTTNTFAKNKGNFVHGRLDLFESYEINLKNMI